MTQPFSEGGYIPGPHLVTASLPPEPLVISDLRRALERHDDFPGTSDPVAEAVIDAARALLAEIDTERQRMLSAMQTQLSAEAMRQLDKPILDRMRDANNDQIREAARRNTLADDKREGTGWGAVT